MTSVFDFNGFAQDVHKVAVEHGWWEGERDEAEIFALIHSEWSEALEEHRAGRPMVWRECINTGAVCDREACGEWDRECGACGAHDEGKKPEGIAVELIDGVLRCMDYLAAKDAEYDEAWQSDEFERVLCSSWICETSLPKLVLLLHEAVSMFTATSCEDERFLWTCIHTVYAWLIINDVDPEAVIRAKHEYNKTRPYKHGKRY